MSLRRAAALMLVVSGCVALGGVALAQAPSKAEQALKYRKSLYQVIGWNFGPMSAMAQGKIPYDAKQFALRADRVAAVAPMLSEAFPAESQGVSGSKLKPAMWENRADFDAKLQDFVDASARLATVARTGDFAKSKEAFLATGNTCKACHDRYKAD